MKFYLHLTNWLDALSQFSDWVTQYYDIIDWCHQQSGELYKILLFDLGHLAIYTIKIEGS